jgi:pilus assembly protein Flp/PilA
MINLYAKLRARLAERDRGATAVEYGLMVALIAMAIVGIVFVLGGSLSELFSDVDSCISGGDCPSSGGDD